MTSASPEVRAGFASRVACIGCVTSGASEERTLNLLGTGRNLQSRFARHSQFSPAFRNRPSGSMKLKYGELFERLGIKDMGRQGALWCAFDPEGVLVLMAHQNYFRRERGVWQYEMPRYEGMPPRGAAAVRSLEMLENYFAPGRPITLPVAVFTRDGGMRADGTFEAAEFGYATGDVYRGTMRYFERATAHLVCDCLRKSSLY